MVPPHRLPVWNLVKDDVEVCSAESLVCSASSPHGGGGLRSEGLGEHPHEGIPCDPGVGVVRS